MYGATSTMGYGYGSWCKRGRSLGVLGGDGRRRSGADDGRMRRRDSKALTESDIIYLPEEAKEPNQVPIRSKSGATTGSQVCLEYY